MEVEQRLGRWVPKRWWEQAVMDFAVRKELMEEYREGGGDESV